MHGLTVQAHAIITVWVLQGVVKDESEGLTRLLDSLVRAIENTGNNPREVLDEALLDATAVALGERILEQAGGSQN